MDINKEIIKWPCYEPAGKNVALTESDLLQHALVIGSTGCGKTTLLTSAIRQLMQVRSQSAGENVGLLILDAKNDEVVQQIKTDAGKAGRLDDVICFGSQGDYAFDLFAGLESLDDVETVAARLMYGVDQFGGDNKYWWQACQSMLVSALTMLVVAEAPITYHYAVDFLRRWFLSPATPPEVFNLVDSLKDHADHHFLVALALDQIKLWEDLDSRTRTNTQSCLINLLRPLFGTAAGRCFDVRIRPCTTPSRAVTEGKICVVSVPALIDPELAKFFFRLAKQNFYTEVQRRTGREHRLCGIIADELPLIVTPDDIEQLATVRSKRCFVLGATQGLEGLIQKLGTVAGRTLINNFNTTVLMRTREAESGVYALLALGNREIKKITKIEPADENLTTDTLYQYESEATVEVPICPLGSLGRLAPHQAYIAHSDGKRTEAPVWFAPWFDAEPAAQVEPVFGSPKIYFSVEHTSKIMAAAGFQPVTPESVAASAAQLLHQSHQAYLKMALSFFQSHCAMVPHGLSELPSSWLAALPQILWKSRKPHWHHLPYFIDYFKMEQGMLLVSFAQEQPHPEGKVTNWDRLRIVLNSGLYPSVWRELSIRDRLRLWCASSGNKPHNNPLL